MTHGSKMNFKRIILILVLALCVIPLTQAAVHLLFPSTNQNVQAANGGLTIFFKNNANWADVYLFHTGADWWNSPKMTKLSTDNNGWWVYTIPGRSDSSFVFKAWFGDPGTTNRAPCGGCADYWTNTDSAWWSHSGTNQATFGGTTIPADSTAPPAPSGLAVSNLTSTGFTLTWNSVLDSGAGVGVKHYEVFRDGVSVGTVNTFSTAAPNTIQNTYSLSVSSLTPKTSYSMTVRAVDYANNSSAASTATSVYTPAINVDGTNDFKSSANGNANETFATSTGGHFSYLTWDNNNVYIGSNGSDIGNTSDPDRTQKWFLSWVGEGGTTTSLAYGGNTARTIPFAAKYHLRWKFDGSFFNGKVHSGGNWNTDITMGSVARNGNMMEFSVPRSSLGNPNTLPYVSYWLSEKVNSEWTWAATPNNLFVDGKNPAWTSAFYEFDLTSSTGAAAQWYNYEFRQSSKTKNSITFGFKAPTGATGVKIQQSTNSGATWTDSTHTALLATSTTATVTNLSPTTTYKFRLVVTGGTLAGSSTIETVTTNANSAPVATNGTLTTNEDTTGTGTASATDADNDTRTFEVVTNGTLGTLTFTNANTGAYSYVPNANANGTDTITFRVFDGTAYSANATITVTVTAVNDAPTITDITDKSTNEDTATSAISFTIGDLETTNAASLTVTGSSSNTTLVPGANIAFGGSGANRTVTITPVANLSGTTTITISVSDGALTTTDTFVLTVNAVNDAPTISDIANQTTNEDTATNAIAFTVDDIDSTVSALTVTASSSNTTLVPNGNISVGGSGANRTVTITPAGNQNGTSTITVTVSDGSLTASDTFVLTVTAVNDAPTISDVANQTTNEDTAKGAISVTVDDIDSTVSGLTVTATSSNTTLVPNANISVGGSGANRTVTITPVANQNGTSTITVTVSDGTLTSSDTFLLTVSAVNDGPTISDVANQTTNEDTATGAIAVTVDDIDSTVGGLTVTATSSNTTLVPNGNISVGGSGANRTVTITPAANQNGTTTITVTVSDGSITASDTFVLTVNAVNDAPTISNVIDTSTNEDTATSAIAVTVDDIDSVVANLTMSGTSSNTTLVPNTSIVFGGSGANRTVTVTPAANQTGTATITITVSDGTLTASDTFVLTVNAVNDAPTIADITNKTTDEDTTTSAISISINDIDTALTSLTVTATSSNQTIVPNANISISGTTGSRSMTITPATNQNGTVTITVTVSDGALTATDTFDLVISAVNDAPTISDIANSSTNEDTATSAINFTVGDVETAAGSLVLTGTSSNTALVPNGSISFGGTGASRTVTMTPVANQSGTTTITITVSDGTLTAQDTFVLTVNAVNDAPTATAGTLSTNENVAANGNLSGTDIEGNTLTYAIVTQPSKGSVSLNSTTGAYTYTPNTSAWGSDSFTFKVNDGSADSAAATISITINAVNDAPVSSNGTLSATEDTESTGSLNATDTDGDPLVYSVVTQGSKGTVTITNTATGAYKYVPNANANGQDTFTFRVNDGLVNSNTSTITVTIAAVNDAPTASNDTLSATEDTTANGALSATDIEGTSLTYSVVTNGSKGTVTITNAATGAYSYVPNANANGSDTFTFRVTDGELFSNTATITVNITAVNDAPTASNGSLSVTEDTSKDGSLSANDIDSANLTYTIIVNGTKGTVTITNADTGEYTYVPNANAIGSDSFTFRVSDGVANSNIATINVTITAVNDAPTLTTVTTLTGATEDTALNIGYSALAAAANEGDVDGDTLSFKIVAISTGTLTVNGAPATAGTTIVSSGDTLVWTPAANANGNLNAFTIVATDGTLESASAVQVTVAVSPVNDIPTLTTISNLTGGQENQTYEITYDSLLSAANEADVEGSTISFRIEAVTAGTLTKGGVAVTASTTLLGPGESLIWTPVLNADGTTAAFTVVAFDGSATSATPVTVNVVLATDTTAPSVPVGMTAVNITKNSFRVQWNAVNDSPSLGTVKYIVRFNGVDLAPTTSTFADFPISGGSLTENTNYAGITVKAVDEAGNVSNATTAITVRTLDGTNPNAPAGTPTISDKTGSGFTVSWTAASDNANGSGIKEYEVMVGADMYGPTTSTTLVITGLSEYTVYEVKVRAVDNDGNKSSWSTSVNPRTNDVTLPTVPTGVAASNINATTFTLSWTASTDNVGISGYNVYLNGVKKNSDVIVGTTYNVTGVTRNVPYTVTVRAVDSSGNESTASTGINVTPVDVTPPTAPTGLATTSKNFTAFGLTWTASTDNVEVAKYNIYVNGTKHGESATTTYNVTGVTQGNTYTVVVKAVDLDGNESAGATLEVPLTDFDKPIWPGTVDADVVRTVVSRTFNSMTVSWTAASDVVEGVAGTGVGGYSVTVTSPTVGASGTGTFETNTNQITLTNLRPDTTYVLAIRAFDNAANFSDPQVRFAKTQGATSHPIFEAKTTLDVVLPTAPSALDDTNITPSTVEIEWTGSSDNDLVEGYNVYVQLKLLDGSYRSSELVNPFIMVDDPSTPDTNAATLKKFLLVEDTEYVISGLLPNREYRIVVRAVDRAGNLSSASNALVITIDGDTEGPTLAPGAAITANELHAIQERQIKINWPGTFVDNVDSNLTYEVYVNNVKIVTQNPIVATTFTITGLTPGTEYQVRVKAFDRSGNESEQSTPTFTVSTLADLIAPSKPVATANNVTATSVRVTWTASTDTIGAAPRVVYTNLPVAKYRVYLGTPDGVDIDWEQVQELNVPVSKLEFLINGLTPGTTGYKIKVTAVDVAGNESAIVSADEKSFNTVADTIKPTNPTNLRITPAGADKLNFTWTASTDNDEVVGYKVFTISEVPGASETWVERSIGLITGTSYEIDLTVAPYAAPVTAIRLRVVAYDAIGNASANDNPTDKVGFLVRYGDTTAPNAPTQPEAKKLTANSFEFAWRAATDNTGGSGISRYEIYQDDELIGTSTTTTFVITGLVPETTYTDANDNGFSVRAVDVAGNASTLVLLTTVTTAKDTTAPTTPVVKLQSKTFNTLVFEFTNSTDNIGIETYQYRVANTATSFEDNWQTATSPITISGLALNTTRFIQVRAFDVSGNNSSVGPASATTDGDKVVPTAPAAIVLTPFVNSVTVSWSPGTDNTEVIGYRVYRLAGTTLTQLTTTLPASARSFEVTKLNAHDDIASAIPLNADTSYTFVVRTVDIAGNLSANTSGTTKTLKTNVFEIEPPTISIKTEVNMTVGQDGSQFTIQWTPPVGVTVKEYEFFLNGVSSGKLIVGNGFVPERTFEKLVPSTTYVVSMLTHTTDNQTLSFSNTLSQTTAADTMKPTAPTNIVAPTASITASTIRLNFSGATDNVAIKQYLVYQNGVLVVTKTVTGNNDHFAIITGLTPSTEYTFTVKTVDTSDNESEAASSEYKFSTIGDLVPPSVPGGLAASNPTRTGTVAGFTVTWNASEDGVGVTGYTVYLNGVAVTPNVTSGTSYTFTNLVYNTQYRITVLAFDAADNKSALSALLNYTTPADTTSPSAAPGNLAVSEIKNTSARLTWTAGSDDVGVTGYQISGNNGFVTIVVTGLTRVVTLQPDTTYNMQIRSVDAAGNTSSAALFTQFTTNGDDQNPEAPTGLMAHFNADSDKYTLVWNKAFDNDAVVTYEIRNDADDELIKEHPASTNALTTETVDIDASEINGKKIYIKAIDRSENPSAKSVKLLVDDFDGTMTTGITSVTFNGLFTRNKTAISYLTTVETRMTLRVYPYVDGEKGALPVTGTILNNVLTKAGAKNVNIPAGNMADGSYYVEYIITNKDATVTKSYGAILTVSKLAPVIYPDTGGTKAIQNGWAVPGADAAPEITTVEFEFGLTKNSIVNIVINDSKRSTVKTIKSNVRMLATPGSFITIPDSNPPVMGWVGQEHKFTWDGTNNAGVNVTDGTYTVVYNSVDSLGIKAGQKTQTVRVERKRPEITLITSHVRPGKSLTIHYNVDELATVFGSYKLCSNDFTADPYSFDPAKPTDLPTDTCTAVTGSSINATGLLKIGANRMTVKLPDTIAPGKYYLLMRVRDTAGASTGQTLNASTAKTNEVAKFEIIVDGQVPGVTDTTATNVVGSGTSTIGYKLSETSLLTVTVRSGATYQKSRVVATLVNNELRVVAGTDPASFSATWNGLDFRGRTAPNSTATLKYWVDVRAVDLAGNVSISTLDASYKEFSKSAS